MARKVMVHLYYHSKKLCRMDCDILGIDRRRVISIGGHTTTVFQDADGNRMLPGCYVTKQMIAKLIVNAELVDKHLDDLHHDDDETWS